jgi:voltage-gated potassium channel
VVELPRRTVHPLRPLLWRVGLALALVTAVAVLAYAGGDGYTDPEDGEVSLLDAFYYSTVSVTTTGYGDIRPVSDTARLLNVLLVTPMRVLFLILLVGTTLEILAERSREAFRRDRWRRTLKDHVIICGFGTKGRTAVKTLLAKGAEPEDIVVLDPRPDRRTEALAQGFAAVAGDASTMAALLEAGVREARSVVVAVDRDDTAVLATLTARELNASATIVAAVREEENVHLLHQSGATSVITSSGAAGRLLGHAVDAPRVTEVLEDLLAVGAGLDVAERPVGPDEAGPLTALRCEGPVVGVVREDVVLRFDDARAETVRPGDRVVFLRSHRP